MTWRDRRRSSWDHQPLVDAGNQYMRNHLELDELERRARFPLPGAAAP